MHWHSVKDRLSMLLYKYCISLHLHLFGEVFEMVMVGDVMM